MMLAKSLQSAAGNAAAEANYIESVFQTHLYTGNGSTQTITNGIDLAGEGGMVWFKRRNGAGEHSLFDTVRGATKYLQTHLTNAEVTNATSLTAFNADGFSLGANGVNNGSTETFASWTFRKQPKFFDVVTYTGNGSTGKYNISHSLGSVPGCIIVKRTDSTSDWFVYHRGIPAGGAPAGASGVIRLNTTAAYTNIVWTGWGVTATTFSPPSISGSPDANVSGATYVAYLFAHNAGGFGLSGEDNVISCGSYTADGTDKTISLGYEPQWVMVKRATNIGDWIMLDTMRNWSTSTESYLKANTSGAEDNGNTDGNPTATGFFIEGAGNLGTQYAGANQTMIYIAIRRGPMKVPESGTSVFTTVKASGGTGLKTTNFPVDLAISKNSYEPGVSSSNYVKDRLRGAATTANLATNATDAEFSLTSGVTGFDNQNSIFWTTNGSGYQLLSWCFRRAPGFFDEVCYTGTGSARTVAHNLGAVPELLIVKSRSTAARAWMTYTATTGATQYLMVQSTNASATGSFAWNDTSPTSSNFTVGAGVDTNESGSTYVAYLFASCPGVSKVGSYTGTGAAQTIDCGFAAGARFVLIKGATRAGGWYVWDTARGIVSGNDPSLRLNISSAEDTTTDWINPASSGFQITSTAGAVINEAGFTFIYLAIA